MTVFEPGSNNLPYIRQNLADVSNIRLIEKGCGFAAGQLEFFEDSLTGQNNSFVESFDGLRANIDAAPNVNVAINTTIVNVVRLDEEIGLSVPDFIKIDVEGYKSPVLQDSSGWFGEGQKPPIITIEVQADFEEIGDWMYGRGYTLFEANALEIFGIPHSTLNLEHHAAALSRWQSQ